MLHANFKFLCRLANKTQKEVLADLNFSDGIAWQWKTRNTASDGTLKRLAKYFSEKTSIPYPEFDEGRALLKKDFRKTHEKDREQKLQVREPDPSLRILKHIGVDENRPEITTLEQFIDEIKQRAALYNRTFPEIQAALKHFLIMYDMGYGDTVYLRRMWESFAVHELVSRGGHYGDIQPDRGGD